MAASELQHRYALIGTAAPALPAYVRGLAASRVAHLDHMHVASIDVRKTDTVIRIHMLQIAHALTHIRGTRRAHVCGDAVYGHRHTGRRERRPKVDLSSVNAHTGNIELNTVIPRAIRATQHSHSDSLTSDTYAVLRLSCTVAERSVKAS